MELRQLHYLVAVAEEASFTKAASRLHVAQPGISAQIRRLERELGQELLDRSGREVTLTGAGAAVLPFARAALGSVEGLRQAVDDLTGLVRGRVRVGMATGCAALGLPDLLSAFNGEHPGVEISLTEANSDELIEGIRDGRLDLALIGLAGGLPSGLQTALVVDEPLIAAVGRGQRFDAPIGGRGRLRVAELEGLPLISLPHGTGLRAALEAGCASAGVKPTIAFEAGDPRVLAELARRGLGIAILPASAVEKDDDGLRGIPIERPVLRGRIELAWRAEGPSGPAAHALIELAKTVLT
jgi:DNA-binding transcriptional LysR family regulator